MQLYIEATLNGPDWERAITKFLEDKGLIPTNSKLEIQKLEQLKDTKCCKISFSIREK